MVVRIYMALTWLLIAIIALPFAAIEWAIENDRWRSCLVVLVIVFAYVMAASCEKAENERLQPLTQQQQAEVVNRWYEQVRP